MLTPTPREKEILDDVKARTGLSSARLEGIDTRDKSIAEAVLPVLAEWVFKVDDDSYRHALYSRFHTPHAHPYMEQLMTWCANEQYHLAVDCLTQILSDLAKPQDAEKLWKLCQQAPSIARDFYLLAKLAVLPATKHEVRDRLVEALQDPLLTVGDLNDIGKVDDPRIRSWFQGQLSSPNKNVRQVAKRVVDRGKKLPDGPVYSNERPNKVTDELFSTEVDLKAVPALLRQLEKRLELKIPVWIRRIGFLSAVPVDQWLAASILTKQGEPVRLWFRLEDIDTVELVVTGDTHVHPKAQ